MQVEVPRSDAEGPPVPSSTCATPLPQIADLLNQPRGDAKDEEQFQRSLQSLRSPQQLAAALQGDVLPLAGAPAAAPVGPTASQHMPDGSGGSSRQQLASQDAAQHRSQQQSNPWQAQSSTAFSHMDLSQYLQQQQQQQQQMLCGAHLQDPGAAAALQGLGVESAQGFGVLSSGGAAAGLPSVGAGTAAAFTGSLEEVMAGPVRQAFLTAGISLSALQPTGLPVSYPPYFGTGLADMTGGAAAAGPLAGPFPAASDPAAAATAGGGGHESYLQMLQDDEHRRIPTHHVEMGPGCVVQKLKLQDLDEIKGEPFTGPERPSMYSACCGGHAAGAAAAGGGASAPRCTVLYRACFTLRGDVEPAAGAAGAAEAAGGGGGTPAAGSAACCVATPPRLSLPPDPVMFINRPPNKRAAAAAGLKSSAAAAKRGPAASGEEESYADAGAAEDGQGDEGGLQAVAGVPVTSASLSATASPSTSSSGGRAAAAAAAAAAGKGAAAGEDSDGVRRSPRRKVEPKRGKSLAQHQTHGAPDVELARFRCQAFGAAKVAADMLRTVVKRDAALNLAQQIDKFKAAGESSGVAKPGRQAVRALAGAAKSIYMSSTSQLLKTADKIHTTRLRNPQAYSRKEDNHGHHAGHEGWIQCRGYGVAPSQEAEARQAAQKQAEAEELKGKAWRKKIKACEDDALAAREQFEAMVQEVWVMRGEQEGKLSAASVQHPPCCAVPLGPKAGSQAADELRQALQRRWRQQALERRPGPQVALLCGLLPMGTAIPAGRTVVHSPHMQQRLRQEALATLDTLMHKQQQQQEHHEQEQQPGPAGPAATGALSACTRSSAHTGTGDGRGVAAGAAAAAAEAETAAAAAASATLGVRKPGPLAAGSTFRLGGPLNPAAPAAMAAAAAAAAQALVANPTAVQEGQLAVMGQEAAGAAAAAAGAPPEASAGRASRKRRCPAHLQDMVMEQQQQGSSAAGQQRKQQKQKQAINPAVPGFEASPPEVGSQGAGADASVMQGAAEGGPGLSDSEEEDEDSEDEEWVNRKCAVRGAPEGEDRYISLADLRERFGMTEVDAAESLGISATAFKGLMRSRDITCWPFRGYRSLTGLIQKVEAFQPDEAVQGSRDEVLRDLRKALRTFVRHPNKKLDVRVDKLRTAVYRLRHKRARRAGGADKTEAEVEADAEAGAGG